MKASPSPTLRRTRHLVIAAILKALWKLVAGTVLVYLFRRDEAEGV
jgi:hypothetical protein